MGHLTGDFAIDLAILVGSAVFGGTATLLWWSVRRNIAAMDERQKQFEATGRQFAERLWDHQTRLAVVEDRLDPRRP